MRGTRGTVAVDRALLAWQIAGCPHFRDFDRGQAGACTDVIKAQGRFRRSPEGWTGRLLQAPILFVTSNPHTNVDQPGTDPDFKTPEELAIFNDLYFDSHPVSGARTWSQMQKWATTLRGGRGTIPGRDFVLTDAVRCASPAQEGVDRAMGRCASLYLGRILTLSAATVIGFCGKARTALRNFIEPERYRVDLAVDQVIGPLEFFWRDRMLIGLRHPADFRHGDLDLTRLGAHNLAALQSRIG
jgi:hypothetical protein